MFSFSIVLEGCWKRVHGCMCFIEELGPLDLSRGLLSEMCQRGTISALRKSAPESSTLSESSLPISRLVSPCGTHTSPDVVTVLEYSYCMCSSGIPHAPTVVVAFNTNNRCRLVTGCHTVHPYHQYAHPSLSHNPSLPPSPLPSCISATPLCIFQPTLLSIHSHTQPKQPFPVCLLHPHRRHPQLVTTTTHTHTPFILSFSPHPI